MFIPRLFHALALLAILLAALGLRLVHNADTVVDQPMRGDAVAYATYAANLIDYGVFSKDWQNTPPLPDAYWSPGYPVFVAGVMTLAEHLDVNNYQLLLLVQAALGTLVVLLSYLLARCVLPRFWSLLPTALVAASPHMVSIGQLMLTETLFAFVLLLALWLYARAADTGRGSMLAAGMAFACAYLVNPVSFFLAPLLALLLWLKPAGAERADAGRRATLVALLLMPLILVAIAWFVRGVMVVPDGAQTSSGRLLINLIIGMHSDYYDIWRANPRDPTNPVALDEAAIDGSLLEFARVLWTRLAADPAHYLSWYLVQKPLLLWDWDIRLGAGDIYVFPVLVSFYQTSAGGLASYAVMQTLHPWLLAASLGSLLWIAGRRFASDRAALAVALCLVYVSAVYVVTQAEPRYSVPMRPQLYLLATLLVYWIACWLQQRRAP